MDFSDISIQARQIIMVLAQPTGLGEGDGPSTSVQEPAFVEKPAITQVS
jgi:hypothetical protein